MSLEVIDRRSPNAKRVHKHLPNRSPTCTIQDHLVGKRARAKAFPLSPPRQRPLLHRRALAMRTTSREPGSPRERLLHARPHNRHPICACLDRRHGKPVLESLSDLPSKPPSPRLFHRVGSRKDGQVQPMAMQPPRNALSRLLERPQHMLSLGARQTLVEKR